MTWQLDRNKSGQSEKRRSGQFHTHRDGTLCALGELELAYIHVAGAFAPDRGNLAESPLGEHLRGAYRGLLIASGAYTPDAALAAVESRWADAIGFDLIVGRDDDLVRTLAAAIPPAR